MRQIINTFSVLLAFVFITFICLSVNGAAIASAEAKEYKEDVIAQIENSNFNPNIIDACKVQAQSAGYTLDITNCEYDENNFISCAEVVLTYKYTLPLFSLEETKTTRGIAR